MTRFEFTEKLRKALSGRVNYQIVNENVAYYEMYIDTEIKKGRSEKEVLSELGDPRLLARTIIDTAQESDKVYGEEEEGRSGKHLFGRILHLPSWVFILVLFLIFILILNVVGFVIATVLPVALPLLVIYYVIRYFRRRK